MDYGAEPANQSPATPETIDHKPSTACVVPTAKSWATGLWAPGRGHSRAKATSLLSKAPLNDFGKSRSLKSHTHFT